MCADTLIYIRQWELNSQSGFTFKEDSWAQIIPGEEEGLLGWMSVNYLNESPGNWGVMVRFFFKYYFLYLD